MRRIAGPGQWTLYRLALVLNDALAVGLAFRLAHIARFQSALPIFEPEAPPAPQFYSSLVFVILPAWLVAYALFGLYHKRNLLGGIEEYALVFKATTAGLLLVIIAEFLLPELVIARGWLLAAWGMAFLLSSAGRFGLRRVVYALRKRGHFVVPALVVGNNAEGRLLAEQLRLWRTSGLELVGIVGDESQEASEEEPIAGSLAELDELVTKHGVGELVLATSALPREELLSIFKRYGVANGVNLRLSSGLFEVITTGLDVREIGYVPLVTVNKVRLTGADRVLKLLLDYTITIPALLLLSPILLLAAVATKLDSAGPIIHRRRVMGLNGGQFDAYKFRTMVTNGSQLLETRPELMAKLAENHKLKEDPRVTDLGRLLRRFSLDELPQLFNVLKGEMSLVGPRMISPEEMPKYNQWGINLLTVRPGITGLWQVSGRSDVSYDERVRLDMHYIRNWSIWLDLHVLLQTIPAVLRARGAY